MENTSQGFDNEWVKRYVFVSVVGWISAILSGLMVWLSGFWMVSAWLVLQERQARSSTEPHHYYDISAFDFPHGLPPWANSFYGALFCVGLTFLVGSIGLIQRKSWGRKMFIGITALLLLLLVAGLVGYLLLLSSLRLAPVISVLTLGYGLPYLMFIGMLILIIRRLWSAPYRRLFQDPERLREENSGFGQRPDRRPGL